MYTLFLWASLKDRASFDFEIHEIGHQEYLTIDDRDVASHKKIISRKYNTHDKSEI
jgi:hypothetical protein